MRRRIAGMLIRLAHRVYRPNITMEHVNAEVRRIAAEERMAKDARLQAAAAARLGSALANRAVQYGSEAGRAFAEGIGAAAAGPDPRPLCGDHRPDGGYGECCIRPVGHKGQHGWAGMFWDSPGVTL